MSHCVIPGCDCTEKSSCEKFYLRDEVVVHNKISDFWVILHGTVLDLTIFLKTRQDSMTSSLQLLLQYGGKDVSHFFHLDNIPLTRITTTGATVPVFPPVMETAGSDVFGSRILSWWQDPTYVIGRITKQPRKLRIINTLIASTQNMVVCEEDTVREIQKKYDHYNWNQQNYHWCTYDPERDCYEDICPNKTLTENGFHWNDYREPHTPSLWLFFIDK